MAEINFPDPAVTNPWQDPASLQWWEHDGDGWLRTEATTPAILTGYKNVIINGRLGIDHTDLAAMPWVINQRGFNGDWGSLAVLDYGFDRWALAGDGVRIWQKIEFINMVDGAAYTLSWDGGGDGEAGREGISPFIIGVSPLTFTYVDNAVNLPMMYVPINASNIQLELGSVATNFEVRPVGLELQLCQRYYQTYTFFARVQPRHADNLYSYGAGSLLAEMRVIPNVEFTGAPGSTSTWDGAALQVHERGFTCNARCTSNFGAATAQFSFNDVKLDSEL